MSEEDVLLTSVPVVALTGGVELTAGAPSVVTGVVV
jgi:hypothetical protein